MERFNNLACSTIRILHDSSSNRREPDRFLSIKNYDTIVRKDFIIIDN